MNEATWDVIVEAAAPPDLSAGATSRPLPWRTGPGLRCWVISQSRITAHASASGEHVTGSRRPRSAPGAPGIVPATATCAVVRRRPCCRSRCWTMASRSWPGSRRWAARARKRPLAHCALAQGCCNLRAFTASWARGDSPPGTRRWMGRWGYRPIAAYGSSSVKSSGYHVKHE